MPSRPPSFPKSPLKSRSDLRRALTRASAAAALALLVAGHSVQAANTGDAVKTAATDLGNNTTTTYTAVAGTTSDVQFLAATTYTSPLALSTALAIGTLNDLNATAITINGTALLTFSTAANSTSGANSADLLYVAGGANLTINDTAGITFTPSGNVDAVGTLSLGASPLTITAGTTLTFTGAGTTSAGGAIAATTGALTVNKVGGTLTLSGANLYSGATSVNAGTLSLDFSANAAPTTATNIIKSGNNINLGGGALVVKGGGANATNTQTFTTTALTANTASTITGNVNGGTALNLALGSITRNAQSAVDITFGGANITTSATGGAGGLLGDSNNVAYATAAGGTTFVAKGGTTPFTLSALPTASYTHTYATGNNVDVQSGDSQTGVTVNTLRFNAASDALTLSGTNILNAAAILVTPTGTGSSITGGTITSTTGAAEVVIHDYGTFNEGAVIANANAGATATKLTIAGNGTTTLSVANTITGQTALLGGTLNLSNSLALQNSPLQYNTGTTLVFDQSVTSNAFTLGGLSSSNNIALVNNATTPAALALTLNVATGGTYTYSGVLSGTGASLTKTGAGTQILSGASTYTGATAVNGGVLNLTGSILNSAVTVGTGAQILFTSNNNESVFVAGGIAGLGGIAFNFNNPSNVYTLNEANTYTGATTFQTRGVFQPGVSTVYSGGVPVSGAFGVNSALTFVNGSGGETVILKGFNEQVGGLNGGQTGNGIVLNGGNLTIGGDNANATFAGQITGGLIPNGATGTHYNGLGTAANIGGNLVKIGTGVQTFSSPNLYTGTTTVNGGTLSISSIANGGIATTVTTTAAAGATTLTVASATGVTAGQNVVGSGGLQSQTVSSVSGNTVTLSTATTDQAVNSGTAVYFGTGNGLGISTNAAANLVLDGGTLQYTGAAASTDRLFTVGSTEAAGATGTLDASGTGALNFTNTGAIAYGTTNQPRTLGLTGTNTGANTLNPVIGDNGTGAVSVTKSGAGTWILAAANTYSGSTTVGNGALLVNGSLNPATPASSSIAVNGGTLGGTGILTVANATVNPGGTLAPGATLGATTGALTLNTTGGLTINGGLTIGVTTGGAGTSLATNGSLTLGTGATLTINGTLDGASNYDVANYGTLSGTFTTFTAPSGYTINYAGTTFGASDIELDVTAVPEPSTYVGCLLLLGGAAWSYGRRHRRVVS